MEANELRIGNYVKMPNLIKPIKVSIIDTTQTSRKTKAEPIFLTKEWLLKLGYFELDHIGGIHYVVKGHTIWLCNDLLMCEKNGIILKHVHQLQNLYFALTGNELIFKDK